MKKILILILILSNFGLCRAQSNTAKIEGINVYTNFMNEGIHGMLIVHRLLENYNQEINKYADLESYVINNFSNADLPANIFQDPENWFYDTSPLEWNEKAATSNALSVSEKTTLQNDVLGLIKILSSINKIRFEVETLIADNDLSQRSQLVKVYEKLEEGVTHYEQYYQKHLLLIQKLQLQYNSVKPATNSLRYSELYKMLNKIYLSSRYALIAIREKNDEALPKLINDLESGIIRLQAYDIDSQADSKLKSQNVKRGIKNILDRSKATLEELKLFYGDGTVPREFVNHSRYYYYYNSDIINNFNRYGNGIVFEINRIFDYLDMPVLQFLELPHYYKVIYPKLISETEPIAAANPNIAVTPQQLKARVIEKASTIIEVDSLVFQIEIYDSKIKDGDVISFNFNKDWLLNEEKLSDKPVKLTLQLNEKGKNFFVLHSDDMGRNPPTTIGVRYRYKGEEKTIKLSSNLNTSEMIEIIYKPN